MAAAQLVNGGKQRRPARSKSRPLHGRTPQSTITGATTLAQLVESLAARDLVLEAETLRRIDDIDEAIPCPMTEDGLRRL